MLYISITSRSPFGIILLSINNTIYCITFGLLATTGQQRLSIETFSIIIHGFLNLSVDDRLDDAFALARHGHPALGKLYHVESVHHAVAERVADLALGTVELPVCRRQVGRLGRLDYDVLNVAPTQVRIRFERQCFCCCCCCC